MEVFWFVLAIAVCVVLAWLGLRIEPHFASKDGTRFLCMGQRMNRQGDILGRWRETRVVIERNGGIQVDQKRFMRRNTTFWRIEARSDQAPKRKALYLLQGHDEEGQPLLLALRMPARSRAVTAMDALLQRTPGARPTRPEPSVQTTTESAPSTVADSTDDNPADAGSTADADTTADSTAEADGTPR